jgi:hypothetical protein
MQYDLEFLKALLAASTRVTLGDGAKVTQDLRITVQGSDVIFPNPVSTASLQSRTSSRR